MKKQVTLVLVSALFLLTSCSYQPGVSEAYAKYRFKDGVTTVTIPGWVIHLATSFADIDESEQEILECIDKVKVIAVDDNDLNARIDLHDEFYAKINRKGDFEELMVVRDQNEKVTIFGKMDNHVIEELVILVGGDDNALVYIKGEIKPELISNKLDLSNPEKFLSLNF